MKKQLKKHIVKTDVDAIERLNSDVISGTGKETKHSGEIAVVGMACRFPGASNYTEFWNNLLSGTDSISEIPADRWDWRQYFCEAGSEVEANKACSKWGGFIENADRFDASFFGISPREAESIDPQQRIMLELAWQCIEDAGYVPADLSGHNMGVYIGACNFDYKTLQEKYCAAVEGHTSTGNANTIIPNRVSYFFNFHGPSIAIDTACSSSLVAIHQAVAAIRAGECEAALVGGISLLATPDRYISFSKVGMLSPTGSCKTFDETADGYVRGEGGGLVFLKPLSKAMEDGDRILGVVRGGAVNHGGRTRSLTAPSALSQSKVIAAAFRQAGISPSTVGYVETHGTGTPLGDPIEIHGLTRAFEQGQAADGGVRRAGYCGLGAVKSNIGHLESAAGIAGVIKALLAMKHRTLPGNMHFSSLNTRIKLEGSPFYILDACREWTPMVAEDGFQLPLRAGVSSFGFGGVNSHIILEQAPQPHSSSAMDRFQSGYRESERGERELVTGAANFLLTLSANCAASLQQLSRNYAELLRSDGAALADLCRQANTTRAQMGCRLSIIAASGDEMAGALEAYAHNGKLLPGAALAENNEKPVIGFLFTGQGSQYVGMGRQLYAEQEVFRKAIQHCDALLEPYLERSLIELLFSCDQATLSQTRYTQAALFAVEYALAELWKSCGITPDVVMGHSVGEIVAACVAGVFSLEDAIRVIARRGQLMGALETGGGMAAVMLDVEELQELIERHALAVDVAAVNAPQSTVISGARAPLQAAIKLLRDGGVEVKELDVTQAFHSRLMDPLQAEFYDTVCQVTLHEPNMRIISNVSGTAVSAELRDPHYWADHIRRPVLFQRGVEAMREMGVNVFLEIGPSAVLTAMARRTIKQESAWLTSLRPGTPDREHLLGTLRELFTLGCKPDFRALYGKAPHTRIELPPYPFSGQRYWVPDAPISERVPALDRLLSGSADPLLGRHLDMAGSDTEHYVSSLGRAEFDYLKEHKVRGIAWMPGAAYLTMALAAARDVYGNSREHGRLMVTDATFHRPIVLEEGVMLQTLLKTADSAGSRLFEIWSCLPCGSQFDAGGRTPSSGNSWVLNASGAVCAQPQQAEDDAGCELADLDCGEQVDVAELYARLKRKGLEYGPAFQGIDTLRTQGDKAVAVISGPESFGGSGPYTWNPALLDALFQSAFALLPSDAFLHDRLPLPALLEGMHITGGLPSRFVVITRLASADAVTGIYRCDFQLLSVTGQALGTITGLELRRVAPAMNANAANGQGGAREEFLYQPSWYRPANDLIDGEVRVPGAERMDGSVMLVYSDASAALAEATAQKILAKNVVRVAIKPGISRHGGNHYAVDAEDTEAFDRILAAHRDIQCIYFFGGVADHGTLALRADDNQAMSAFEATQRQGVLCLFHLVKSLGHAGMADRGLILKVVTNRSYAVHDADALVPWGAGALGLASVFCNENPAVRLVNIDLALDPDPQGQLAASQLRVLAERLVAEPASEQGNTVAYRNNHRYCRRIESVRLPEVRDVPYRQNGVYLILGGAGGIGLALSRYLATSHQARLVWVGRSVLDDAKKLAIAEIEAAGGTVMYCEADGCDAGSMRRVVEATRQRFGQINGVIHSALVLKDQSLAKMDVATFRAGLDPKVSGSWALFQAVRDESLDFMLFFSSAVAFLANRGQANYVAGCAFQDAFAHYLKREHAVPVKVINWGSWASVGAVASDDYVKRLAAQGIQAIDPVQGTALIGRVLAAPAVQVIPIRADRSFLEKIDVDLLSDVRWVDGHTGSNDRLWADEITPAPSLPCEAAIFKESYDAVNHLSQSLILRSFMDMLGTTDLQEIRSSVDFKARLRLLGSYGSFYLASLEMLEQAGILRLDGDAIAISVPPAVADWAALAAIKDALLTNYPWLTSEIRLLWACGSNLTKVLRGEVAATSVIFPNLSMDLVAGIYTDGPLAHYCNQRVADAVLKSVRAAMSQDPAPAGKIRILEIGAGTGGTSRMILEYLQAEVADPQTAIEYVYTDISAAFLQHGKQRFGADHPLLRFKVLNIEQAVEPQGYECGTFDIVIASNVLHATRDLSHTLQNAKCLLKRGGVLILSELTQKQNFLTLTFGLLDGWWLSQDRAKRISHSPILTLPMWQETLYEEGYSQLAFLTESADIKDVAFQAVVVAQSDGRYRRWLGEQPAPSSRTDGKRSAAARQAEARVSADDVMALGQSATQEDMQGTLLAYLRDELLEVLHLSRADIAGAKRPLPDLFLSELGMDSLTAMDLRNRLRKQFAIDITVEALLGGAKIQAVIDMIYEQLLLRRLVNNQQQSKGDGLEAEHGSENMETLVL